MYQGGNFEDLVERTGWPKGQTVYVGDHIFGDILRSRKSGGWRTVMIVQEMETELGRFAELRDELAMIRYLEEELQRVTNELSHDQWLDLQLEGLAPMLSSQGTGAADEEVVALARTQLRAARERMKRKRRDLLGQLRSHEDELEQRFNPYWGLIFKMFNKNSVFGEQVEDYACLYTSRVDNFVNYSPMHDFRAPRQPMPHEIG